MLTLTEFAQELADGTREAFSERHVHPFLVFQFEEERSNPWSFNTTLMDPAGNDVLRPIGVRLRSDADRVRVLAVSKAPGNPYPDRIGVGRAKTVDVCLKLRPVSKLHAYFYPGPDGALDLEDLGSTNGTKVNGRELVKGQRVRVTPGDTISFGSVAVKLYGPLQFRDLVEHHLARAGVVVKG